MFKSLKTVKNNNGGFTLLELLIYMAILAGFLSVIVNMFYTISSSSAKEEVRFEVQQNLRFAIQQITDEARNSSSIISATEDTLRLAVSGKITEFKVIGGVLRKTTDAGGAGEKTESVTNDKVKVMVDIANPIFIKLGNTIQINLKIDYNDNGRGNYKFSDRAQTTVLLRNQ